VDLSANIIHRTSNKPLSSNKRSPAWADPQSRNILNRDGKAGAPSTRPWTARPALCSCERGGHPPRLFVLTNKLATHPSSSAPCRKEEGGREKDNGVEKMRKREGESKTKQDGRLGRNRCRSGIRDASELLERMYQVGGGAGQYHFTGRWRHEMGKKTIIIGLSYLTFCVGCRHENGSQLHW